jgi:hypothetical protein
MSAQLDEVFTTIKGVLEQHSPPFVARTGQVKGKADYHLVSEKQVTIDGRPRSEVYFAAVIAQKGYVGLYYMPVSTDRERKELFEPELLALLKGKSCFHVKRLDGGLLQQISDALQRGRGLYEERGWV